LGDDADAMADEITEVIRKFRAYDPSVGISGWDWPKLTFDDLRWRTMEEMDKKIIPAIEKVLNQIHDKYGACPSYHIEAGDEDSGEVVKEWEG
jgi:hypothetical protein